MNGKVISNAELSDSATQNAAFYLIARPDDATQSNISWYDTPFDDEPIDDSFDNDTVRPIIRSARSSGCASPPSRRRSVRKYGARRRIRSRIRFISFSR